MIFFAFVKRALARIDQHATERLTYQQLRHLDPHLLEDIGLKLDGQQVIELHPHQGREQSLPSANAKLHDAPKALALEPEQSGSGGFGLEPQSGGG